MGFTYTPAIPVAGTFVGAWEFSPNHLAPYSALAVYKSGAPVLVDDTAPLPVAFATAQHVIVDSVTGSVTVTGTLKSILRGGAKGSTTAADVTSTASGADHNAADVILYDASGNPLGTVSNRLAVTLGSAVANGGTLPSLINVIAGYDGSAARAVKTAASGALDIVSNGANIATQTTLAALLTSISDGTLRGITAEKAWTPATGSTLATAGQQIVTGACVVRALWMFNNTGASIIVYLADRTSTIANGTIPAGSGGGMGCTGTLGTGGPVNGIPTGMALEGGIPFTNGLWAQASSTISTMTSQGSTSVYWVCLYRAGTGL